MGALLAALAAPALLFSLLLWLDPARRWSARTRLGPAVAPREIAPLDDIPKTKSGKIMRRLLKARELGLPIGDLSTLEGRA